MTTLEDVVRTVGLLAAASALAAGCAFSSYQSARTVPAGSVTMGAAVNEYGIQADSGGGDTEGFEVMGSYGVTDRFELGGKFAFFSEMDVRGYDLLVTPKVVLVPEQLAFVAQSGVILIDGDNADVDNGWLSMPGLVFSHQFVPDLGLDVTGKLVLGFSDNFDDYNVAGGANVSLRVTPGGSAWAIVPEVGIVYDDDASDSNYYSQFGLAFTYQLGGRRP